MAAVMVSLAITRHLRLEGYWTVVRFFVSLIQNSAFPQNPLTGLIKWEKKPLKPTNQTNKINKLKKQANKQTKIKWGRFILFSLFYW